MAIGVREGDFGELAAKGFGHEGHSLGCSAHCQAQENGIDVSTIVSPANLKFAISNLKFAMLFNDA